VVAGAGWAVEDEAERRSATRVIADRRRRREHELERLACSGVDCERIADEGLEHGERQVFRRIGGECTHNAYDAGRDGGPTSADHPPWAAKALSGLLIVVGRACGPFPSHAPRARPRT